MRFSWFAVGVLACGACGGRTGVFLPLDSTASAGSTAVSVGGGRGGPSAGVGGTGEGGALGVAGVPSVGGTLGVSGSGGSHAGAGGNALGGDAGYAGSLYEAAGAAGTAGTGSAAPLCVPECVPGAACELVNGKGACVVILAPRPIAPLSTATVTARQPTFRWVLASGDSGGQVELYRDRACTKFVTSFARAGSSGKPGAPLAAGLYFWRVRGLSGSNVGVSSSPVWELVVGQLSAPLDTSWGTTGDFNGDGFSEVVNGTSDTNGLTGSIQIHFGSATGAGSAITTLLPPNPAAVFPKLGTSVASAGDVNGDGFADLIVGAPGGTFQPGAAYLYFGAALGLPTTPSLTLSSNVPTGLFGWSVSSAGDVNGDGYADVAVVEFGSGLTHVYEGNAAGTLVTHTVFGTPKASSVAAAGDVNGDGFGDLVVGAYSANTSAGSIKVYFGNPAGAAGFGQPLEIDNPIGTYGYFGYSVAGAGDVNGDGYADILVGAPGTTPTGYVYLGGNVGVQTSFIKLTYLGQYANYLGFPSTEYGAAVSGAGDVNGDGYADVVIGASNDRAIYLYLGGGSGLSTTATLFTDTHGLFGSSLAGGGDVNGDGFSDVLVGARGVGYPAQPGFIALFPGGISGLSTPQSIADIGDTQAVAE